MIIREDIYSALFELIGAVDGLAVRDRKLVHWADCPEFPALYQHQLAETMTKAGRGIPSKHNMPCEFYLYVQVPDGKSAAPILNGFIDKIQAALAPKGGLDKQTLGNLVTDCWIEGQIMTDEGVLGETGVAIIPVSIVVA